MYSFGYCLQAPSISARSCYLTSLHMLVEYQLRFHVYILSTSLDHRSSFLQSILYYAYRELTMALTSRPIPASSTSNLAVSLPGFRLLFGGRCGLPNARVFSLALSQRIGNKKSIIYLYPSRVSSSID